jgi:hypothetical protein
MNHFYLLFVVWAKFDACTGLSDRVGIYVYMNRASSSCYKGCSTQNSSIPKRLESVIALVARYSSLSSGDECLFLSSVALPKFGLPCFKSGLANSVSHKQRLKIHHCSKGDPISGEITTTHCYCSRNGIPQVSPYTKTIIDRFSPQFEL